MTTSFTRPLFGPAGAFVDDPVTRDAVLGLGLAPETIEAFMQAVEELSYCELTSRRGARSFGRRDDGRWVVLA